MPRHGPLLVALVLASVACRPGCPDLGFGGACTEEPQCDRVPAVVVDVRNAATGDVEVAPTRSAETPGARGVIRDGAYRDSLRVTYSSRDGRTVLTAGAGRPGTYAVRVEKPGFEPWVRAAIEVGAGECGPATRRLTARLEPDGGRVSRPRPPPSGPGP